MSLLLAVCWDRGDEPGGAATAFPASSAGAAAALPGDSGVTTAAEPGGSIGARARSSRESGGRIRPSREPGARARPSREPGGHTGTPSRTPASRTATATPAPTSRAPRPPASPRPLPPSRATRLLIPYLRLDAPVMDLGLDRDQRLTAPPEDDPKLVGWYKHGASPGGEGTAVAVGHLDTDSGPAVFAGLTELEPGRIVEVHRADGRIAVYAVDTVRAYRKADFPSREVYGARGRPELRLITCSGDYDRREGYAGNLVVFAHLTGTH
ncbi:class F sortase [Streptomyces sp. NPDC019990]|uniref:class F sortase n=1 Tax=Streptomyces sp. NPDC019990 TaxID=3154693 RepID=UPI0033F99E1D